MPSCKGKSDYGLPCDMANSCKVQNRKRLVNQLVWLDLIVSNEKSFKSKSSPHIVKARKIYNVDSIIPSKTLAKKTGCSIASLKKIVKKGEGAYFSSGSRPNQTAKSWGYARLASSITGGKAAAIDYNILENGCKLKSGALRLAKNARIKHGFGRRKTSSITL